MGKFVNDILKTSGKWSFKRVTALFVLFISIGYAFIPVFIPTFNVLEFVFFGFITYSASMAGMMLHQKLSEYSKNSAEDNSTFKEEDRYKNY